MEDIIIDNLIESIKERDGIKLYKFNSCAYDWD